MKIVYLVLITFFTCPLVFSQTIHSPLKFNQGQTFYINLKVKTSISQQAMGQAIDFNVDAIGDHRFAVTNVTEDNTTLHHDVTRLRFLFDGMGQKRAFDSNEEKDMNGPFGKYAKDILGKKYDMVIDPQGQTLMVIPDKISLAETDARLAIINTMLKDVVSIIYPPKKEEPGFFQVFPNDSLATGLAWTRNANDSSVNIRELYKISEINDSTIVIDYNAESVTITRAEMMGNQTVTTLNNKSTGKILVDRKTRLLLGKNITTESHGNSEAPFGTIPVTSKSEMILTVSSELK
jgi:hypothetical protein